MLVAGVAGAAILGQAPAVSAKSSQYPYGSMPCVWAPYATTGKTARWCRGYEWGKIRGSPAAASVISPYGYYYRNCTDYAAWKVSALGVKPAQYRGLGNAKLWAARAPAHGLRVDNQPAVGAVAVRTAGTFGHLGFVEEVNPAGYPRGTIKVSQYNYHADGNYTERYGTPAFFGFVAFVHFEDYARKPAVPKPKPAPKPTPLPPAASPEPIAEQPKVIPVTTPPPPPETPPPKEMVSMPTKVKLAEKPAPKKQPNTVRQLPGKAAVATAAVVRPPPAPPPQTSPPARVEPPFTFAAVTPGNWLTTEVKHTKAYVPEPSHWNAWPVYGLIIFPLVQAISYRRLLL